MLVFRFNTAFVVLSWIAPAEGGRAGIYQVLRRDGKKSGTWINADVSPARQVKLLEKPRQIDMEYRGVA